MIAASQSRQHPRRRRRPAATRHRTYSGDEAAATCCALDGELHGGPVPTVSSWRLPEARPSSGRHVRTSASHRPSLPDGPAAFCLARRRPCRLVNSNAARVDTQGWLMLSVSLVLGAVRARDDPGALTPAPGVGGTRHSGQAHAADRPHPPAAPGCRPGAALRCARCVGPGAGGLQPVQHCRVCPVAGGSDFHWVFALRSSGTPVW